MGQAGDSAAAGNLLKIGDVSRLSGVSVRMLRHYDDLGLLRPALVDEFSGYRYYHADQLYRLHRLLAFKEMGFSLARVACLLDGRLPSDAVRTLLEERRGEVEREIQERQARLAQVSAQIRHFDPDLPLAGYAVTLGPVAPVRVAGRGPWCVPTGTASRYSSACAPTLSAEASRPPVRAWLSTTTRTRASTTWTLRLPTPSPPPPPPSRTRTRG